MIVFLVGEVGQGIAATVSLWKNLAIRQIYTHNPNSRYGVWFLMLIGMQRIPENSRHKTYFNKPDDLVVQIMQQCKLMSGTLP